MKSELMESLFCIVGCAEMGFFIHKITVFHFENDESVTKHIFNKVYFRHNKKSNVIDKRTGEGVDWFCCYTDIG